MSKRRLSATEATECSNKRINVSNDNLRAIRKTIDRLTADSATDEMIREVTSIIDDLDKTCYKALKARSEALRKQGKFCDAIKDAEEMIRIKPTSRQGYLLAGNLYSIQGRQLQVMRVLDDGLNVLPESDHQLLNEKRQAAYRLYLIRIDFVAKLPHEITAKIFKFLADVNENAVFSSTLVSKHWRHTLLSIPQLWTHASNFDKPDAAFRLLPSVSKHVKVLDIGKFTKKLGAMLISMAESKMFSSLTALCIDYGQNVDTNTYMSLLTLLGEQLEDFAINGKRSYPPECPTPLDAILSACVNLKRLVLLVPESDIEFDLAKTSHPSPLQLKMLFLEGRNENSVLEKLLPQCPRLRVLYMLPDRPTLLQSLYQHCPYLQQLNIKDRSNDYSLTEFPALDKYEFGQQPLGLKQLVCNHSEDEWTINLRDLLPFITKSKDTLKDLVLRMSSNDNNVMQQEHWDSLAIGPYPQLTAIDITWWDETPGRPTGICISRMLRQCSSLESVRIGVDHYVQVPDDFFTSLTASPYLSDLAIYFLTGSLGGLDRLFKHHATSNTPSTLQELVIHQCAAMTDDCLYAIASLPALVDLTIIGPLPLITREGMVNFLKKLGCTQSLLSLTLVEMNYLDNSHVYEFEDDTAFERLLFVNREEEDSSGQKYNCSTTRLKAPIVGY